MFHPFHGTRAARFRVTMRALVVGGSGYLGQFVIQSMLDAGYAHVFYTYGNNKLPSDVGGGRCSGYKVDVSNGEGMKECINAMVSSTGGLDVVVNCAAMSSPGDCEKNPELANLTNAPKALLLALRDAYPPAVKRGQTGPDEKKPLLIHVSTDQVYCGSYENNLELDGPHVAPANKYGVSKLNAEKIVRETWPFAQCVVLRSSIITGPQAPFQAVNRPLFLDFILNSLKGDVAVTFFHDEFRNPIAACDIARHILVLAASKPGTMRGVFNCGGPDRVSRVGMAKKTASALGWSDKNILSAPSASVDRGVKSPLDISMDSSKLENATGVRASGWELQTKLAAGVRYIR